MQQDYSSYTKQDFLQDNLFVKGVKYPTAWSRDFWNKYAGSNPGNLSAYVSAVEELEYILEAAMITKAPEGLKEQIWNHIAAELPQARSKYQSIRLIRNWSVAASILIGLITTGLILHNLYYAQQHNIATPYNMVREVILPDSSRIVLNSNSRVTYKAHWKSDQSREIWLNGEAYFEVVHKNKNIRHILNGERFIVHAGKLDIQVLGTVFNVKARSRDNSVVLVSGKVAVRVNGAGQWKILHPGEAYNYIVSDQKKTVSHVDPTILTAWKDRSVILPSNTRLIDIIPQLEENYGVHIKLTSAVLGEKALEGTLPLTNQENLFFILSNVLKVDISKKDSTWTFSPQKP